MSGPEIATVQVLRLPGSDDIPLPRRATVASAGVDLRACVEDALEIGLVDELGGFHTAFRAAREAAGLEADDALRVRVYPRPRSAFEVLFDEGGESSEPSAQVAVALRLLEIARPAARLARRVGLIEDRGALTMEVEPAP